MNGTQLQQWLGAHGTPVMVDGKPGPKTREAIKAAFVNLCAPAITDDDVASLAASLGCSTKQIRAIATVESGGSAYDTHGRPKILFERHKFHAATNGRWSTSAWSNPKAGGYGEDSWEKLAQAACRDADAAFGSTSWGRFQVMGFHWRALGYASPIDMAYATVTSEAAHYDMLARFLRAMGLVDELRAISADPDTCRPLAKGYNGAGYERFDYHNKLARAMR